MPRMSLLNIMLLGVTTIYPITSYTLDNNQIVKEKNFSNKNEYDYSDGNTPFKNSPNSFDKTL